MYRNLGDKIKKLTIELTEIPSIVSTREEINVVKKIYDKFTNMKYFKKHPEMVRYIDVIDDSLNRKSVLAMVKGQKGNNNKTVLLIGHTDTVGTSDYGNIKEYATRPLELPDRLKSISIPEDALKDLESGKYLFGRGVFDMKCGTATLMTIVEELSNNVENLEGNIVFAAVCDEEGNSGGMLSVVPELVKLREKENFEYQAAIDADYMAPRYEGDINRYVYVGTVGKLMPSFYVIGSEAHGGDPFKGLDPNHISSAIIEEIDFNTKYCDEVEGEVTVPPISLRQQDLKPEYSVQTAKTSYLYFNFDTHSSAPDEMMNRIIDGTTLAFQRVINSLNEEYKKYCVANGFPYEKLPWKPRVISYSELYDKVKLEQGDKVDKVIDDLNKALLSDESIDERMHALKMVQTVHSMWSDRNPVVIVYFSPPYYPHIHVKGETELEKNLLNVVNDVIESTASKYNIKMKKFYPYISDLSYTAAPNESNAIDSLKNNMPGFGTKYILPIEEMQALNLPVVNIGPFGKDAHKFTERLEEDYSFNIVPKLIYKTIENLLK
ncbi:M20/M25/M40 family metallo-hydrolase [Schnuerera sp. xch1]|uniref:M20/M25/M40 family metallo-hydrolase n=1 Tax=Schnuerera sp. xch1 TaxID=2874283 RepID=UPI001CBD943B|nr:M20/M25/M40 family metallo-hydrolase [Schnuerera sp. xch1]MBZ2175093.1 M20/M25/M40 family metallo-hydrolase [Schnuerera sp. xch1]